MGEFKSASATGPSVIVIGAGAGGVAIAARFTFSNVYLGISPYDSPGTFGFLQYAEPTGAIWYRLGGYHKVHYWESV
ncbi:hypothetical protein PTT_04492 [Pyrenophora teres f. teres 0-1]|uniref:Uncharacterized protein n=1 Tax=Pyrenophora teres f. teres (strain 0-1) TaxID=861557 RepID=E3REJ2_PYRTT|nr:hypothetical protein PTT_04492 [Pyrenophora teres f. teres 0-1]